MTADDAGQGAFHSGNDDNDVSRIQPRLFGEEPMDAGDPDIVQAVDLIPHNLGRNNGFFGDRQVGGPGGNDEDAAALAEWHRQVDAWLVGGTRQRDVVM